MLKRVIIPLAIAMVSLLYGGEVTFHDIAPAMDEMFSCHVSYKRLTPTIAGRSLRTFIDRFDPHRMYLLKKEVYPFLEKDEWGLEALASEVAKGDYKEFKALDKKIVQAILRARKIRAAVRSELLNQNALDLVHGYKEPVNFASTEEDLYKNFYNLSVFWLAKYCTEQGKTSLDLEERLKVLNYYEKKRRGHEDRYIATHSEKEKKLPINILKAVAGSLDAHTMFYTEEEAQGIRSLLQKELYGVGIHLKEEVDGAVITQIIEGSPASRNGKIREGDILVKIDGQDIESWSFRSILGKLDGSENRKVKITVQGKNGAKDEFILEKERLILEEDRIQFSYEPFAGGVIGKITMTSFYDNGSNITLEKDIREALKELNAVGPIYGLILDIRQNGGGFLHQAVKTASLFVRHGVIVVAKYAGDQIEYTRDFDFKNFYDGPLVVLTSRASASAAEILAQSLKDDGSAIIVGDDRTYGKGSMQYQTITDLQAKYFYKVTVGKYFTASGASTQIKGVESDVVVPTKYGYHPIGEKYLKFPLDAEMLVSKTTIKDDLKAIFTQYVNKPPSKWEKMIPILKQNSENRLHKDENFQAFLRYLQKEEGAQLFGKDDLQMKEAIELIKDMIILSPLS